MSKAFKRYRYEADDDKAREEYEYEWVAQGEAEQHKDYAEEEELPAVRKTNAHVAEPFRSIINNTILTTIAKKEIA